MSAPTTPGSLGRQGQRTGEHLAALERSEDVAVEYAAESIRAVWVETSAELDRILAAIAKRREGGEEVSQAWLYRATRLRAVLTGLSERVAALGPGVAQTFRSVQAAAIALGARHAADEMHGTFAEWSPRDMRAIFAALSPATPLTQHLAKLGSEAAERLRHALLVGISLGKGVDWMRRQSQKAVQMPAWRLETLIRTESMRAFRYSTREAFATNPSVKAWRWVAKLDARTCPACVILHGQEFPVEEVQDGHPRCRCVMVPVTESWDELLGESSGIPDTNLALVSGKEWLETQPTDVVRAILGPAKWKAWSEGEVTLDEMVTRDHSDEWGTMRREASLSEIRARRRHP